MDPMSSIGMLMRSDGSTAVLQGVYTRLILTTWNCSWGSQVRRMTSCWR